MPKRRGKLFGVYAYEYTPCLSFDVKNNTFNLNKKYTKYWIKKKKKKKIIDQYIQCDIPAVFKIMLTLVETILKLLLGMRHFQFCQF